MNKKVLITAIILVIAILSFQYILKIFFPQEFVFAISNQKIIKFGEFVDNHLWANILCGSIIGFIASYLYVCAITKQHKPTKLQFLFIAIDIIIENVLYIIGEQNIYSYYSYVRWLLLALLCKAQLKETVIVYATHFLAQTLSVSIRGISNYISNYNFATFLLLALECYFWLLLFYLIFNYKESSYGKNSAFIRQ